MEVPKLYRAVAWLEMAAVISCTKIVAEIHLSTTLQGRWKEFESMSRKALASLWCRNLTQRRISAVIISKGIWLDGYREWLNKENDLQGQ
jgi:hypothetical protein